MNSNNSRRLFKLSVAGNVEVKDLLQALFSMELISPSRCIWLVSPWITDVPILDNSTGAFNSIHPGWGRRPLRMMELFVTLVQLGTHMVVVTRPDDHNKSFVNGLRAMMVDLGMERRLTITIKNDLHLKGLLGDQYYLSGSMNFTNNGVNILEEGLTFDTDPKYVAQAHVDFHHYFGGVLK